MYIPAGFRMDDKAALIAFMRRYSFATIINYANNIPIATHLPFFVDDNDGRLVLSAHFAAVNQQAGCIADQTSLVIFSEPHAYISPVHYDKKESVPTWDYLAVHAYGKAKVLEDDASKIRVLEQMIRFYEPSYMEQWNNDLSEKYKAGMLRGIVAFEMEVTELQGQQKLSQNKTVAERQRIIRQLEQGEEGTEKTLATYIHNTIL